MLRKITKIGNKESLTTKLTLIIIGLTAGSALLIPATYASFHPVTSGEIADNTIQSVDIGNGQVRTGDILDGQVYSVDIRDGQVGSVDIGDGQVSTEDIADNAIQPNIQRASQGELVEANTFEHVDADCPDGTIPTGGGFQTSDFVQVYRSFPSDSNTWSVSGINTSINQDSDLTAYVICIGPMP